MKKSQFKIMLKEEINKTYPEWNDAFESFFTDGITFKKIVFRGHKFFANNKIYNKKQMDRCIKRKYTQDITLEKSTDFVYIEKINEDTPKIKDMSFGFFVGNEKQDFQRARDISQKEMWEILKKNKLYFYV